MESIPRKTPGSFFPVFNHSCILKPGCLPQLVSLYIEAWGAPSYLRYLLTIFVVCLFIQENVGLHVPDELVGKKLRRLCRPQDVLPHVTHLSTSRGDLQLLINISINLAAYLKSHFAHFFHLLDEYVYLIITESLYNLRNVEQDGILKGDNKCMKHQAGNAAVAPAHREKRIPLNWCQDGRVSACVTYWRKGAQHLNPILSS